MDPRGALRQSNIEAAAELELELGSDTPHSLSLSVKEFSSSRDDCDMTLLAYLVS